MANAETPPVFDALLDEAIVQSKESIAISSFDSPSSDNAHDCQLVTIAWLHSPSVLVLQGEEQEVSGIVRAVNQCMGSCCKIACIDSLSQMDEALLVQFLADAWGVGFECSIDGDLAGFIKVVEQNKNIATRYLLQINNLHALGGEQWQMLRMLHQSDQQSFGILLIGMHLDKLCDKFLTPFGISCLYHNLKGSVATGSPANANDSNNPADKKKAALPRNLYLISVGILLLGLFLFQQEISRWVSSPQVIEPKLLGENRSEEAPLLVPEKIKRVLPLKEEMLVRNVVVSNVAKSTESKKVFDDDSIERDREIVNALPIAVSRPPLPVESAHNRKGNSEEWILSQPAEHYTLHVMSVRSEQNLQKLIQDQNLAPKAAYYKAMRASGVWYVLLIGHYSAIDDAKKDIPDIEQQLGVGSVIARKFERFQKDIKKSQH